jgi:hypothetical protein
MQNLLFLFVIFAILFRILINDDDDDDKGNKIKLGKINLCSSYFN